MKKKMVALLATGILIFMLSGAANATMWNWSFGNETGQFVTDGIGSKPGTYSLIDFSVTSSSVGGTIGSFSSGQYVDGFYRTYFPYSFAYDGSTVTSWNHSGPNDFDWWAFSSLTSNISYLFGYDSGGTNNPYMATWYNSTTGQLGSDLINVVCADAAPVPEPATLLLMGIGLLGLTGYHRKRFSKNNKH